MRYKSRTIFPLLCVLIFLPFASFVVADVEERSSSDFQRDQQPAPIKKVPAVYPPDLKKKGIEGKVVVEFIVDYSGNVAEAYVIDESKNAPWQFQYAAVVAVWQWKFRPGIKDGRPVSARMQLPFIFEMSNN